LHFFFLIMSFILVLVFSNLCSFLFFKFYELVCVCVCFFFFIYYIIFLKKILCVLLLIKTLKPLFINACLYLWIRLCGTTKDEFMINIIHLHI
jgi:hypothetical protein